MKPQTTQPNSHTEIEAESELAAIISRNPKVNAIVAAEIDRQFEEAKDHRRSVGMFRDRFLQLAGQDMDVLASLTYSVPRGGKRLEGPSIRCAELVASAWGNLRFGSRVVSETDTFVVAEGYCHDLETNTQFSSEVRRRITGTNGKRFNDDMIGVTCNAACSIAVRNAIFRVVPFAIVKPVIDEALSLLEKKAGTLSDWRKKIQAAAAEWGIPVERIAPVLGVSSLHEIAWQHAKEWIRLRTAISEGHATVDDVFPPTVEAPSAIGAIASLRAKKSPDTPTADPPKAEQASGTGDTTPRQMCVDAWCACEGSTNDPSLAAAALELWFADFEVELLMGEPHVDDVPRLIEAIRCVNHREYETQAEAQ